MKRWLLALVLIASTIGFCGPAQAVVLNNGIVVITNHKSDAIRVSLRHVGSLLGDIEYANVLPGQTWRSSACCFAAGTRYEMIVDYRWSATKVETFHHFFTPHLCSRNGIPYGYHEVELRKDIVLTEPNDKACYEGPL